MLEPKPLKPRTRKGKLVFIDEEMPPVPEVKIKEDLHWKAWFFLKGKKRAIGIVSYTIGELSGGTVGLVFKAIGAVFGFTGIADPVAKKLNNRTSGEKINWGELLQQLINFLKKLFTKG